MKILFSDVHLGHADFMNIKEFNDFLELCYDDKYEEVIIVGDLFELWTSTVENILGYYRTRQLMKKIADKTTFVPGNHDMLWHYHLKDYFKFNRVVYPEYVFNYCDKVYYVSHGHTYSLESHFRGYKIFSLLMSIGMFSKLFYAMFKEPQYQWLEKIYRRISVNNTNNTIDIQRNAAEELIKTYNYDYIIFGHTHSMLSEGKYYNTGSWLEGMDYLVIDNDGMITTNTYSSMRLL